MAKVVAWDKSDRAMFPNFSNLSLDEPERREASLHASMPCRLFNLSTYKEVPLRREQAYARFEKIRDNNKKNGAGDDASLEQAAKRTKPDEEAKRSANEERTWLTELDSSNPDKDGLDPILFTELANGFVSPENQTTWGNMFDFDVQGTRISMPVPTAWKGGSTCIVALSDPATCGEGDTVTYMLKAPLFMELARQFRENFELSEDNRLRFPEHFYNPLAGTRPSNNKGVLANDSACFYKSPYGTTMLNALLAEARSLTHTVPVGEGPPTTMPLLGGDFVDKGAFSGPPRQRVAAPAAPVAIPQWMRGPQQSEADVERNRVDGSVNSSLAAVDAQTLVRIDALVALYRLCSPLQGPTRSIWSDIYETLRTVRPQTSFSGAPMTEEHYHQMWQLAKDLAWDRFTVKEHIWTEFSKLEETYGIDFSGELDNLRQAEMVHSLNQEARQEELALRQAEARADEERAWQEILQRGGGW